MNRWAEGRCSNSQIHIIQETKRVINGDHDFVNLVRGCASWLITVSCRWLYGFYRTSNFPALPKDLWKVLTCNDFNHLATQGLLAPSINWFVPSDDRKCLFQDFQSKMLTFTTVISTKMPVIYWLRTLQQNLLMSRSFCRGPQGDNDGSEATWGCLCLCEAAGCPFSLA